MKRFVLGLALVASELAAWCAQPAAGETAVMTPVGRWSVKVAVPGGSEAVFELPPVSRAAVKGERHKRLPPPERKAGWAKECKFLAVRACECTVANAVEPDSVVIAAADGRTLERGRDYTFDPKWGGIERLEGATVGADEPITVDYVYRLRRIDSIVRGADGKLSLRAGAPHVATPEPPPLAAGETLLGNVFTDAATQSLSARNLYPVLSRVPPAPASATAEKLLPKTVAKLERGETVTILAWGDSVTVGSFVPKSDRWQERFVRRLKERYPKADIRLVSRGWGGRTSRSFFEAPTGSPYNFAENVAGVKADLVVSEFVNDCSWKEKIVREFYPKYLEAFKAAGSEWIILTPHYVRPDWMGLEDCRDCDDDPRPFVAELRRFADANGVALADAALRWGHLWREGIPFSTLYVNDINHPVSRGMGFFADALMALFPAEKRPN